MESQMKPSSSRNRSLKRSISKDSRDHTANGKHFRYY